MFSDLFHIAQKGDYIQLSIRSEEHRSDVYLLSRNDIEPALDDDPTDNEWSGSSHFSMKRTVKHGFIRIQNQGFSSIFKMRRHQIEVLNARLKGAIEGLPFVEMKEPPIEAQRETVFGGFDEMSFLSEVRTVIQEEFHKIRKQMTALAALDPDPVAQNPEVVPLRAPTTTFIPSKLGEGLEGQVAASKEEQDGSAALKASKKLKELKR